MIDTDGLKLQRLIEKRRMALGMTPNRWRAWLSRLLTVASTIAGILP